MESVDNSPQIGMSSRANHGCINLIGAETISEVCKYRVHISVNQPGGYGFYLCTHDYQAFLEVLRHHFIDRHGFVVRSEDLLDFIASDSSSVNQSRLPLVDSWKIRVQVIVIHIHQQEIIISYVKQMET